MTRFILLFFLLAFHYNAQSQGIKNLSFGSDSTLDIMTWNIERFPKNGQTTIDSVKKVIESLDVDIIAFQEINDKNRFHKLADDLEHYKGFTPENEYNSLAYLYKKEKIDIIGIYEIFTDNWHEFPRAPLILEFEVKGEKLFVINNHLKCCGDGILKTNSYYDEENRRWKASRLLEEYIQNNLPNEKVILVGDLNDNITDKASNNVFVNFVDNPDNFLFADMKIAEGSETHWSYPWYPSHIDHILISNELFEIFYDSISDIKTIRIDKEMKNGMYEYDEKISDHRPVAIKLNLKTTVTKSIAQNTETDFMLFPNPVQHSTTFSFSPINTASQIKIFNSSGIEVYSTEITPGQNRLNWDASSYQSGIYLAKRIEKSGQNAVLKFVISK